MPKIRPSADLRNKYNEISAFCHDHSEPVFITKNGQGDLAVMSIETYEALTGKADLYQKIADGIHDLEINEPIEMEKVFSELREKHAL
ncbi:type II toxin-antitoxin system prevent-host-death family antitoxin [Spirochaeta africana]|uniref:Antitoxin n=1 Tax=Spirochaeta africana (strain ATCC 700263 / DSM 8902 / Z-7692) TaxID=889378 RepID=H9UGX0_SPIAZ|nr:type II toxin-antitoxin system prevent-host-death family antitoxin [Spirochaeta africana]AFG36763.1 prevent-host-death family protein [Spirochaeta africana DSM 8902]